MYPAIIQSLSCTPPVRLKLVLVAALLVFASLGRGEEEVTLQFPPPGSEPLTYVSFCPEHHLGEADAEVLAGEGWLAGPVTTLRVVRTSFLASAYSAQISVRLVSLSSSRPEAVGWRMGGDAWQVFPRLGEWVPLKSLPAGLAEWETEFQLGYHPSLADPPGLYRFQLQFQLDYPQLPEVIRTVYLAQWEMVADWRVGEVVILTVHGPVALGEVGAELFHHQLGFGALEASGYPIWVGTNLASGLVVTLRPHSVWFPAEFSPGRAGLLEDFSVRFQGGHYLPLREGEVEVAEVAPFALYEFLVSYRYQVDEQDVPGEYGLILEYTVSTP